MEETNKTYAEVQSLVAQAIGEASMAWSETPTGTFDSERASKIVDELMALIVELKPDLVVPIYASAVWVGKAGM